MSTRVWSNWAYPPPPTLKKGQHFPSNVPVSVSFRKRGNINECQMIQLSLFSKHKLLADLFVILSSFLKDPQKLTKPDSGKFCSRTKRGLHFLYRSSSYPSLLLPLRIHSKPPPLYSLLHYICALCENPKSIMLTKTISTLKNWDFTKMTHKT